MATTALSISKFRTSTTLRPILNCFIRTKFIQADTIKKHSPYEELKVEIDVSSTKENPMLVNAYGTERTIACVCNDMHFLTLKKGPPVKLKNLESGAHDWYRIDEFVDRDGEISSLRVKDVTRDKTNIYYHSPPPRESTGRAKLVRYDLERDTCEVNVNLSEWPLARLRQLLIQMLPVKRLARELCNIALGPSVFLLALEESLDEFHFVGTDINRRHLAEVETYDHIVDSNVKMISKHRRLMFTIEISRQGAKVPRANTTLAHVVATNGGRLDVLTLRACDIDESTIEARGSRPTQPYRCDHNELLFFIDYYIVSEMATGSLVGQGLEDDTTNQYDFHREPFLRPIGIGCWDGGNVWDQKTLNAAATLQFSAEYATSNGSQGIAYVAFDGHRNLLRLDRLGRKSVYDLERGLSYHVNEFVSFRVPGWAGTPEPAQSCVVLEIEDPTIKGLSSSLVQERLLGIGVQGQTQAYHLGSKVIDHVAYEVYETELVAKNGAYNLPILLEPIWFVMPDAGSEEGRTTGALHQRYFLTYYVEEIANPAAASAPIKVPRFVELWEVNKSHQRRLVNRAGFSEFSWLLDVEPSGDPQSQDLSLLFSVEPCAQERSTQLELRYQIVGQNVAVADGGSGGEEKVADAVMFAALSSNLQLVKERVHETLASSLGLSRLNIVHLEVKILRQQRRRRRAANSLLVDSRVVDLREGVTVSRLLGFLRFDNSISAMKESTIAVHHGLHSLDACKLESISERNTNLALFCPGLTICVLVEPKAATDHFERYFEKDATPPSPTMWRTNDPSQALCEVYRFTSIQGQPTADEESVAALVKYGSYRMSDTEVRIDNLQLPSTATTGSNATKVPLVVHYSGYGHGLEVRPLDSGGNTLGANSPLVGLRYTTMAEEPGSPNMNSQVELWRKSRVFQHCQLACQMDEFCESFSVCKRKKASSDSTLAPSDCVLSNLRLSAERLDELESLASESASKQQSGFELKLTMETESQKLRFRRDPECSLHPKDIMASYKITGSFGSAAGAEFAPNSSLAAAEEPPNTTMAPVGGHKDGQAQDLSISGLSLEECAGTSNEASLARLSHEQHKARIDSNFTYCPLVSLCLLDDAEVELVAVADKSGPCYQYSKSHAQFYERHLFSKLTLVVNSDTGSGAVVATTPTAVDSTSKSTKDPLVQLGVGHQFLGLNEQQCARTCNLRQSKCLAFDSCRFPMMGLSHVISSSLTHTCVLYSIRSPTMIGVDSSGGGKTQLLPQEEQFYSNTSTEAGRSAQLVGGQLECNHFALQGASFDIRLQQLLWLQNNSSRLPFGSREQQSAAAAAAKYEKNTELDKIEDSIIGEDEQRDAELRQQQQETNERITKGGNRMSGGGDDDDNGGHNHNYFLLLLGLTLGLLGTAYAGRTPSFFRSFWDYYKTKRFERYTDRRVSQMPLATRLEL